MLYSCHFSFHSLYADSFETKVLIHYFQFTQKQETTKILQDGCTLFYQVLVTLADSKLQMFQVGSNM